MTVALRNGARLRVASEARTEQLIPSSVLGMLIFIFTEVMFFAGLISAFAIVKASAPLWPPPGQPRLPVEATALNTGVLLLSGLLLLLARRSFHEDRERCVRWLTASMLAGVAFVGFQGFEWAQLLAQGLTFTSSNLGSFFYLIVGLHALHAVVAIGLLVGAWRRLRGGWLASSQLATVEAFWYFVVLLWPVIYGVVYL